jgi:putative glutamine amidotransferase
VSATRPTIGITSSHPPPAPGAAPHSDSAPYVAAVEAAGGRALLLAKDATQLEAVLAACDGIVFSGGCDVDPAYYGEAPHPATQQPDSFRDVFEVALMHAVRERGIPTLCICRGLQVANVAFGGSLVQDLPSEPASPALDHRPVGKNGIEREDYAPGHAVRLEPGGALARLLDSNEAFPTNSIHHQAVRNVAPGLTVAGVAPDGTVEALDAAFAHPYFFAVQWHPEAMPADAVSRRLFGGLIEAARLAQVK